MLPIVKLRQGLLSEDVTSQDLLHADTVTFIAVARRKDETLEPLRVGVVEEDEVFRRGLVAVLTEDDCECIILGSEREPSPEADSSAASLDVAVVCSRLLDRVRLLCPLVCLASPELRDMESCRTSPNVMATLPHEGLKAGELVASVHAAAAGLQVESLSLSRRDEAVLDPRGIEVLKLLAMGADTRAIARKLRLSERTVKTLLHDIEVRLGASTRAQAVAEGVRLGLI
jgi:DNA-binding CsgD family transcriptional regulator